MSLIIRRATRPDVPALIALGRRFNDASGLNLAFSEPRAIQAITAAIDLPDRLALTLATPAGPLAGFLFAHVGLPPFSTTRVVAEDAFWIEPDHRGGRTALRMISEFEAWARAQGAASASLSALQSSRVAALYERLGYVRSEAHFTKGL
jgi:GNAT superfamily N-acetyltransferase